MFWVFFAQNAGGILTFGKVLNFAKGGTSRCVLGNFCPKRIPQSES
jgi:hypothetical protein